jgi:hypothetical protein
MKRQPISESAMTSDWHLPWAAADSSMLRVGDAATLKLSALYESQIEGCKYQNNTDIRHQAFPESIPEEQQIHSNYNGYQQTRVERDNHTFCHFRLLSIRWSINWGACIGRLLSFDTDTDCPKVRKAAGCANFNETRHDNRAALAGSNHDLT